jgi:hypothetical protein
MKRDTLIEHKEVVVICEESGHISLNDNALFTTLEVNTLTKPIVPNCYSKININMYQLW